MIAIILAAGEGSRLKPLSNTIPKPMIQVFGKSILEHNLESIYKFVSEIYIVVKYKKEIIIEAFGNNYKGTKITYFEQNEQKGTAAAIRGINVGKAEILILNGDSIFDKKDLESIIEMPGYGALVKKVSNPSKYGVYKQNTQGLAIEIIEKPEDFVGDLVNLGVYKFNEEIIEISKHISLSKRDEFEITDSINEFIKKYEFHLLEISGEFIDIGYSWDILTANKHFLDKLKENVIKGEVETGVTIKGKIVLEEGAMLKAGTYVEGNIYVGKNTCIGPNAYLRGPTVIGDDCHIGNAVEIKNTSIGNKTNVAHLSYIGDSIIGNSVNIGGGLITANLRHDKKDIRVMVKGELIDTKLHKLGVIIGDNSKTGIKTITYPGRIIEDNTFTMPGEIVK